MENVLTAERMALVVDFFRLPEGASFWALLNSPFLVAILATMIGFRLNARLTATQAETNIALRMAQANTDSNDSELEEQSEEQEIPPEVSLDHLASEAPDSSRPIEETDRAGRIDSDLEELASDLSFSQIAAPPIDRDVSSSSGRDFRGACEGIADKARAFIQEKIDEDRDKRHHRTYKKIHANNPVGRTIALNERDRISDQTSTALIELFETWQKYSKGRAASKAVPRLVFEKMKRAMDKVKP